MAIYGGVKKRTSGGTATVKRSSKPSSSGGSSSRVPANSYGTGEKYLGGNTMQRADGSTYEVKGEFTSPSGKVSYVDDNGDITTVSSRDKSQNGTVYTKNDDGSYSSNYSQKVSRDYANDYANMQVEALREAMGSNIDALNAAYDQSAQRLSNAAKEAKRQAYVNQQKALNTLPQAMAAAGYNGGVTETTAAGLAADYQNALTDVDNNTAEEMARLQADKANGIANVNTTYNTQIANALQQAAQFEQQQRQYAEEMALRQRAQAFEEQKYLNSLNSAGTGGSYKPVLSYDQVKEQVALGNNSDVVKQAAAYYGLDGMPIGTGNTAMSTTIPTTLIEATKLAQAQNSPAPLAAYWARKGLSNAQIANQINEYLQDPESIFYGYKKNADGTLSSWR